MSILQVFKAMSFIRHVYIVSNMQVPIGQCPRSELGFKLVVKSAAVIYDHSSANSLLMRNHSVFASSDSRSKTHFDMASRCALLMCNRYVFSSSDSKSTHCALMVSLCAALNISDSSLYNSAHNSMMRSTVCPTLALIALFSISVVGTSCNGIIVIVHMSRRTNMFIAKEMQSLGTVDELRT